MMDQIISLISNVGFPIACTVVLFMLYNKTITSFQKSIDNNTETTNKLCRLINDFIEKFTKG